MYGVNIPFLGNHSQPCIFGKFGTTLQGMLMETLDSDEDEGDKSSMMIDDNDGNVPVHLVGSTTEFKTAQVREHANMARSANILVTHSLSFGYLVC